MPDRTPTIRSKRILFLLFKSVGDAILATPCFAAVKASSPEARVEVLASEGISSVFSNNPDIDRIIPFRRSWWGKLRAAGSLLGSGLGRGGYDTVINLHGGSTSALFTLLTLCRVRAGYEAYRLRTAYTHRCPPPSRILSRDAIHTTEHRLAMMAWLGFKAPPRAEPKLFPESRGLEEARRLSSAVSGQGGYALVHPGATLESKRWPVERFGAVIRHLWTIHKLKSVAAGGPKEMALLRELQAKHRDLVLPCGDLSLSSLIGLIAGASLYVGNDSGPSHIAAALSIPAVVIFTSSDLTAWRPLSDRCAVVTANAPCSPCPGYRCNEPRRLRCVLDVEPDRVIAAVDRVLHNTAQEA